MMKDKGESPLLLNAQTCVRFAGAVSKRSVVFYSCASDQAAVFAAQIPQAHTVFIGRIEKGFNSRPFGAKCHASFSGTDEFGHSHNNTYLTYSKR